MGREIIETTRIFEAGEMKGFRTQLFFVDEDFVFLDGRRICRLGIDKI